MRISVLLIALSALLPWASPGVAVADLVEVRLGEAGASVPMRLTCDETTRPIEFEASRGNTAREGEGPEAQYLLALAARVRPLELTAGGSFSLSAEVGGQPGASLEGHPERNDGNWVLAWSSNDLVAGPRTGVVPTGGAELRTVNYLPFGTVRPGVNRIRFKLSCFGPGEVAVVSLLGTTSLRETDRAPARLRLTAERSDEDPEAGVPLSLPFEVTNTGDVLARDVEVHLELQGSEAEVVGRRAYLYDSLEGTRRGEFIVVPRRPGGLNVELIAGSANSNQPAVSLRGKAGTRTKTSAAVASPWLAVAVITVIAGVVVMIFRRRRSA